jgi:hypothetical protein
MATKKIYVSASTTGAKATDEVWLSCGSGASIYAQTFSGLTYGWTANASGVSYLDTSAVAGGIYPATTIVPTGTSQKIRVDKAAGTYTLVAVGNVPSGGFASKRLRVLDSDNSTVLWTQPAADIAGAAADYQINTNGALVSYGAADAGVPITTTGAQFYIEIVSTGGFNARYSRFEIIDSAAPTPAISSISPSSGPVGTQVTITGTNLTDATLATHGPSVAMTGLIVDSATQARATIALGSPASGTIRVTTPGGTAASSASFTVPPIYSSLSIVNPNGSYTVGVLLSPITVTALDQFGATFTGSLPNCTVESLTLGISVVGTLSVPFVAGVATFSNLTPANTALPSSPAGGGPAPGGGMLRYYLELQREKLEIEKEIDRIDEQVLYESQAVIDDSVGVAERVQMNLAPELGKFRPMPGFIDELMK